MQTIFGNPISKKTINKSKKNTHKLMKKFGDDSQSNYPLTIENNRIIGTELGVKNIVHERSNENTSFEFDEKSIIIGNIRMGFGHYRISMAIASAAHHMGYTPYWFDLHSFEETTGGKVIKYLNSLYSFGSRLSQKSRLFNQLYWEPLNSEGFKKLSYNAQDQSMTQLMTPIFKLIPKDIPYVATHVWPSQAAVHAGVKSVVNVIPDNWPMALHLSEGAMHTVQTPSSYFGYRTLKHMTREVVSSPMPSESIRNVGHYIDHELVANLEEDTKKRLERINSEKPLRFLLTIGGAGAQKDIFSKVINYLLPYIKQGKATLFINVGDHKLVWDQLILECPQLIEASNLLFDDWSATKKWCEDGISNNVNGIHVFYHKDIFAAVYSTNLLMRMSDVLVTKPSELSFYPIPKLLIKRVGGHEAYGAIRSSEIGDGTLECETNELTLQMLDLMLNSKDILNTMNEDILKANAIGIYNGAYEVVKLAVRKYHC